MTATESALARASWLLRTPELGALRDGRGRDGAPVTIMPYRRPDEPTTRLWCTLPPHRAVIEALGVDGDWLALRYAAIDWRASPAAGSRIDKLTWAAELAEALAHVARAVEPAELGWFACPFVRLDLERRVRIGFAPITADRAPPETQRRWPRCDERALVFAVGASISEWARAPDPVLAPIVARCTDKPARRPSLAELHAALLAAGARAAPPDDLRFDRVELAIGRLLRGWPASARVHLEAAGDHPLARALLRELDHAPAAAPPAPPPSLAPRVLEDEPLPDAADGRAHYLRGRRLFARHCFAEARDAFAVAFARAPQLLEAMLLRREADRALAAIRDSVGTQPAVPLELPAHLRDRVEAALALFDADPRA